MLNGRDINKVLLPVLNASYVVVVGTMARRTASSVYGAAATPTTAATLLASGWPCAPRAHTNGVNRPYRVQ